MGSFLVEGGHRLEGRIRPAGNKNAALPCLAATVLASEPVTLENVPRIRDVLTFLEIVESLGAAVTWPGPNEVTVDPRGIRGGEIDRTLAERIRASLLLAGPLLARFGDVELPPPGGDVIGRRRMDTHFLAFEALGARVKLNGGFRIQAEKLTGADFFLDEPSVTGTENAIMAAVLAEGPSRIRNAAAEPHVQDLCRLLNAMGAGIRGVGTHVLDIDGVDQARWNALQIGRGPHRGRLIHRPGCGHPERPGHRRGSGRASRLDPHRVQTPGDRVRSAGGGPGRLRLATAPGCSGTRTDTSRRSTTVPGRRSPRT